MNGRVIHIGSGCKLSTTLNQLDLRFSDGRHYAVAIEDLSVVILENPQISITQPCLSELSKHKVLVLVADRQHLPTGLFLPVVGHSEQTERLKHQIGASEPLKKQAWKQLIQAKIENQALVLQDFSKPAEARRLLKYARSVLSGDQGNLEASAAQTYWKALGVCLSAPFLRESKGAFPNPLLNYGYALIRASLARGIVASGFHPSLGVFHKNKYNPFCLADDLIEPFRPIVDAWVLQYSKSINQGVWDGLTKSDKEQILSLLLSDLIFKDGRHGFQKGIQVVVSSFVDLLMGRKRKLNLPVYESILHS